MKGNDGKTAPIYFRFEVKQKIRKRKITEVKKNTEAKRSKKKNTEAKRKIWKQNEAKEKFGKRKNLCEMFA
jgi:wobble nucleotide-excising tRNase